MLQRNGRVEGACCVFLKESGWGSLLLEALNPRLDQLLHRWPKSSRTYHEGPMGLQRRKSRRSFQEGRHLELRSALRSFLGDHRVIFVGVC